ncbi:hypothetical protein GCM10028819_43250 [Spirosoma humi]
MSLIQMLVEEMQQDAQIMQKMLERVPNDKYGWQPHPKSMTIRQLTTHIAELPSWVTLALPTEELDFATSPYSPQTVNDTTEVLNLFDQSLAAGKSSLSQTTDDQLEPVWTLRNGDEMHSQTTKGEMIRITFSQIVHHRAQLGVYLRLLTIPIPGSYGPSADEMTV